jgi:hypothetical protein
MLTHDGLSVLGGGADYTLKSQLHAAIVTQWRNRRDSRIRKEQELQQGPLTPTTPVPGHTKGRGGAILDAHSANEHR